MLKRSGKLCSSSDFHRFFSPRGRRLPPMPSLLQVAQKTINLADALPNPRVFQVSSVALEIRSLVQSSRLPSSLALTGTDLDEVMQPSSPDNPRLLAWLRRWQMRVDRPPYVGGPSLPPQRE